MAQPDKTVWKPMATAPRDREIVIRAKGVGVVAVYYVDCGWLRNGPSGDTTITDCWRRTRGNGDDIELSAATGWR